MLKSRSRELQLVSMVLPLPLLSAFHFELWFYIVQSNNIPGLEECVQR